MAKTPQTKTSIAIFNGDFFDFEKPEIHDFDIDVIAHSLSNLCRFTGHTIRHYSVAEHSVLVSRLVPPELAFDGLMHDAAEAYLGDVSSPLKAMLPEYKKIEKRVEAALAEFYGLRFPLPIEVKHADKQLYRQELSQVTNGQDNLWFTDLPDANVLVAGMQAKDAKKAFLNRFKELYAQRHEPVRRERAA